MTADKLVKRQDRIHRCVVCSEGLKGNEGFVPVHSNRGAGPCADKWNAWDMSMRGRALKEAREQRRDS